MSVKNFKYLERIVTAFRRDNRFNIWGFRRVELFDTGIDWQSKNVFSTGRTDIPGNSTNPLETFIESVDEPFNS